MAVTTFERRLPSGSLEFLSTMPQWWQDVLNHRYVDLDGVERPLLIALRDGYFNVYAEGQSVLKIGFDTRRKDEFRVRGELHRKYVLGDDAGDGYLAFDGCQVVDRRDPSFAHPYLGAESLAAWVAAARSYSGGEKRGVARIAESHSNVIDVEMALPANEPLPGEAKAANRMDIVALERDKSIGSGMRLAFYEAKLFSNKELRANDLLPQVLHQLRGYHAYVSEPSRRTQVIDAYRRTCIVLGAISKMQGRTPNEHLSAVNAGVPLVLDPVPRLIIFDYLGNSVGEGTSWQRHEKALRDSGHQLIMASSSGDIRLPT